MSNRTPKSVAAKLRALSPEELIEEYRGGRRQFHAINLLRRELEANFTNDTRFVRTLFNGHVSFRPAVAI